MYNLVFIYLTGFYCREATYSSDFIAVGFYCKEASYLFKWEEPNALSDQNINSVFTNSVKSCKHCEPGRENNLLKRVFLLPLFFQKIIFI